MELIIVMMIVFSISGVMIAFLFLFLLLDYWNFEKEKKDNAKKN
jgi:phosphate/sulfate permease